MSTPTGKPIPGDSPSVTSPSANLKRRRFLLGVSATGAAAAGAAVAASKAAAMVTPGVDKPQDTQSSSGYRETEHVRDYYRTARM